MPNEQYKYEVNFDHNPLGPLPREPEIQPPRIRTTDSTSRRTQNTQDAGVTEAQSANTAKLPSNNYDFDNNFLGGMPEGYVPPEAADGANPGGPSQPFNLAETDEDTQDVITRLFSGDLDKGDEEQINLQLDPTLADPQVPGPESENGKSSQKRKGSSRVNMLTRGGACEFCKRRKLKCTAESPSCAACTRAGRECVYSQKKQKSRVRTLEDRLVELERRLDQDQDGPRAPSIGLGVDQIAPTQAQEDASLNFGLAGDGTSGVWPNGVDWSFLGLGEQAALPEPDLMTLADAAAADGSKAVTTGSWPWDGMDEQTLATEIVKAVEGEKDIMGERIIGHLLSLYHKATDAPYLHLSLSPLALLRRLSSSSLPHPSLLLSILPLVLHLSPSTTLSNPESVKYISKRLETPARLHGLRAFATADPRLVDVMIGNMMRSYEYFVNARLLEGWTEHSSTVGLIWMSGIGKLGGIEQVLGGAKPKGKDEVMLASKDERMRELRFRGVLSRPPATIQEAGDLIDFFWVIYVTNLCASKSWNVPSLIDEDEITTPFPQASYDSVESLRNRPQTISDFLAGEANTGSTDSGFCASIKALCLFSRATRLFDISPSRSTPDKAARLQKLAQDYMATLTPVGGAGDHDFVRLGEAWMALHATLMYLYLKAEIDSPEQSKAAEENLDKALDEGKKIGECIDVLAKRAKNLGGIALLGVSTWTAVGRTVFKLAQRLERLGRGQAARAAKANAVAWKMLDANKVVGKRMPFAQVMSQLLEDISNGIEGKNGEYPREHFAI